MRYQQERQHLDCFDGCWTARHEAHALVGVRARHYSSPSPSTAAHATATYVTPPFH